MRRLPLALLVALAPCLALASGLININTADLSTLEELPHVGATIGQRIIDYRTSNGPFTSVAELQNVSGIGSGSNYADIAPLVTVGDAVPAAPVPDAATTSASFGGSASPYVPPPASITLDIGGARAATLDTPLALSASVKMKNGAEDPSAAVYWSFGDGSSAEGVAVTKTYRYAGTYAVEAIARDADASARADIVVTALPAAVHIAAVSGDGVTLANDGALRLDLSGWSLSADSARFRFPDGTVLLPKTEVLIPWAVMNFPVSLALSLAYPDGAAAAVYPMPAPPAPAQPPALENGFIPVRTVESAPAASTTFSAHAVQTVNAPAATSAMAAAGASLPAQLSASSGVLAGALHSGWAVGFLGILAVVGAAVMIL